MSPVMRRAALGDLCTLVTDGTHDSPKILLEGVPFIKGKHISNGRIDFAACDFISRHDHLEVIARSKPERGDTLFSNIGSVGDAAFVDTDVEFSIKNVALFKPDTSQVEPRYLYYLLCSDRVKGEMLAAKSGSAQPFLSLGALRRHEVDVHASVDTQRLIASILGAYDDLIEMNRRRVTVLEEMARGLFEEWFVRFRFPGHEEVHIVGSHESPRPKGWEVGTLRNIATLKSGFAFKSQTFDPDGLFSLVTIKHVHDGRIVPPFLSKLAELPKNLPTHCRLEVGDMLLSLTGNVGRVCLAWGENLVLNQRVAKVEAARADLRAFAYAWFRQPQTLRLLEQISNGVAQQNLSPVRAMELPFLIPPASLTSAYQAIAGPMLQATINAQITTRNLQSQRDLLLPRLMSGELCVVAAERELEEAA